MLTRGLALSTAAGSSAAASSALARCAAAAPHAPRTLARSMLPLLMQRRALSWFSRGDDAASSSEKQQQQTQQINVEGSDAKQLPWAEQEDPRSKVYTGTEEQIRAQKAKDMRQWNRLTQKVREGKVATADGDGPTSARLIQQRELEQRAQAAVETVRRLQEFSEAELDALSPEELDQVTSDLLHAQRELDAFEKFEETGTVPEEERQPRFYDNMYRSGTLTKHQQALVDKVHEEDIRADIEEQDAMGGVVAPNQHWLSDAALAQLEAERGPLADPDEWVEINGKLLRWGDRRRIHIPDYPAPRPAKSITQLVADVLRTGPKTRAQIFFAINRGPVVAAPAPRGKAAQSKKPPKRTNLLTQHPPAAPTMQEIAKAKAARLAEEAAALVVDETTLPLSYPSGPLRSPQHLTNVLQTMCRGERLYTRPFSSVAPYYTAAEAASTQDIVARFENATDGNANASTGGKVPLRLLGPQSPKAVGRVSRQWVYVLREWSDRRYAARGVERVAKYLRKRLRRISRKREEAEEQSNDMKRLRGRFDAYMTARRKAAAERTRRDMFEGHARGLSLAELREERVNELLLATRDDEEADEELLPASLKLHPLTEKLAEEGLSWMSVNEARRPQVLQELAQARKEDLAQARIEAQVQRELHFEMDALRAGHQVGYPSMGARRTSTAEAYADRFERAKQAEKDAIEKAKWEGPEADARRKAKIKQRQEAQLKAHREKLEREEDEREKQEEQKQAGASQ